MSQFTADYRDLDSATRDYLASVAQCKGRGAPGVYIPGSVGVWPFLSLFVGGIIVLVGLGIALANPKAPWASAMLLTAVALLGGWMILYPFRRWLAGGFGHFSYFDTHNVYQSYGSEVSVANIAAMTGLEPTDNFKNGTYASTTLLFRLPGKSFSINVNHRRWADYVCTYYEKLEFLESDPKYAKLPPAEHGGMAKSLADGYSVLEPTLLALTITELPEEATATRTTEKIRMRYVAIIALATAFYFASWLFLAPLQDQMAFDKAAQHGVKGYRDYLLDEHNTLHRDEAKAKIAEFYQPSIAIANTCPDPVERQAWVDLLTGLSEFEGFPVVSIAVEENAAVRTADVAEREKSLRTWLADSLGSLYGPNFIAFVAPPEGVKPNVEVKYSFFPGEQKITWQITFRTTLLAEPVTGPMHTASNIGATIVFFPPEPFKPQFYAQTFKAAPPPMYAEPAVVGSDDGD